MNRLALPTAPPMIRLTALPLLLIAAAGLGAAFKGCTGQVRTRVQQSAAA